MSASIVLWALSLSILAQVVITSAIFFISGQLLPHTLAALYAWLPNTVVRTVVVSVLLFPPANWLIAYTYAHYPPGMVAPLLLVAVVLANVSFAMLITGVRLSPALCLAVLGMMAFSAWAAILLQQAK